MNDKKTQRFYQNSNHSENCSAKSDKKGLQTSDRTNEFDTKQKYQKQTAEDRDLPIFYTDEVLQMLDLSRSTLFRIRQKLFETKNRRSKTPNKRNKKAWKNRYTTKEIEAIKDYLKSQNPCTCQNAETTDKEEDAQ